MLNKIKTIKEQVKITHTTISILYGTRYMGYRYIQSYINTYILKWELFTKILSYSLYP
jgi:hypothetical protein